jgi:hypothetical protein
MAYRRPCKLATSLRAHFAKLPTRKVTVKSPSLALCVLPRCVFRFLLLAAVVGTAIGLEPTIQRLSAQDLSGSEITDSSAPGQGAGSAAGDPAEPQMRDASASGSATESDRPAASQESEGVDEWINRKFDPIASAWEALVLTSVPVGWRTPSVDRLLEPDTVASVGLDDSTQMRIRELMERRTAAVAQAANGFEKAAEKERINREILAALSPDQRSRFVEPLVVPLVLLLLVFGAAFFTITFGFINVRLLPFAIRVVSGKYEAVEKHGAQAVKADVHQADGDLVDTIRDEGESGEVSHFQALATAVSGTVGLGNIAGVAVAIATGGRGRRSG